MERRITWCSTVANVTVQFQGMADLQAHVQGIADMAQQAVQASLRQFGEEVIGEAKETYVPIRTGALMNSGFVRDDEVQPGVQLGFGGTAVQYAIEVHENPRSGQTGGFSPAGVPYKSYARVGQWKYLEQPLALRAPQVAVALRQTLDDLAMERTSYGSV